MTLEDAEEVTLHLYEHCDPDALVVWGVLPDKRLERCLDVMALYTGLNPELKDVNLREKRKE
jgi:cell division GTPase FtsZ